MDVSVSAIQPHFGGKFCTLQNILYFSQDDEDFGALPESTKKLNFEKKNGHFNSPNMVYSRILQTWVCSRNYETLFLMLVHGLFTVFNLEGFLSDTFTTIQTKNNDLQTKADLLQVHKLILKIIINAKIYQVQIKITQDNHFLKNTEK